MERKPTANSRTTITTLVELASSTVATLLASNKEQQQPKEERQEFTKRKCTYVNTVAVLCCKNQYHCLRCSLCSSFFHNIILLLLSSTLHLLKTMAVASKKQKASSLEVQYTPTTNTITKAGSFAGNDIENFHSHPKILSVKVRTPRTKKVKHAMGHGHIARLSIQAEDQDQQQWSLGKLQSHEAIHEEHRLQHQHLLYYVCNLLQ